MLKNHPPYDVEVDAEVAKEFQRLREEKRRVCPDSVCFGAYPSVGFRGKHPTPWRECGSIPQTPGGHDANDSSEQGQKHGNAGEVTTEPSSPAKMMVTSALTSMTVETTTLVHEPVPAPLLTSMGVVDAQLPTEVHVYSDVTVDVATDANINKQGGHNSPGTDIVAVVEDILQEEGKKSIDSHAIGDPVEPN